MPDDTTKPPLIDDATLTIAAILIGAALCIGLFVAVGRAGDKGAGVMRMVNLLA